MPMVDVERVADPRATPPRPAQRLADVPATTARAALATTLATAVAEVTNHPVRNVHVPFEPAPRGRIAFGGRLVE